MNFRNKSGTQQEEIRKIKKINQRIWLIEITTESRLKFADYLDVTLNLKDSTFRPYR